MNFELEINGVIQEVFVTSSYNENPGFRTILASIDESYVEAHYDDENDVVHIVDAVGYTNPNTMEDITRNSVEMLDYEEEEEPGEFLTAYDMFLGVQQHYVYVHEEEEEEEESEVEYDSDYDSDSTCVQEL